MRQTSPTLAASILAALKEPSRRFQRSDDPGHATVASYNVHKCVGIDGRFDPDRIVEVISELEADIVALQEADERFGRRAGLLDLTKLRDKTDLLPVELPTQSASHGWRGNVLLVRGGVASHVRQIRLPGVEPRGALAVDLDFNDIPVRIIAAHLGLLRQSRAKQTELLLDSARARDKPTILMGDLNEWRVRRRSSLMPLLPHFGPLHAALPSFPSRMPILALDRILASPEQVIAAIAVHDSPLARAASDHLPIKAEIVLNAEQDCAA